MYKYLFVDFSQDIFIIAKTKLTLFGVANARELEV
jgi:hypothetical protein